jgi:HEAT repeat protein
MSPFMPLLEAARPGQYRRNAFRITGLRVDASGRDISRQADKLRLAEKPGSAGAPAAGALVRRLSDTRESVREAARRALRRIDAAWAQTDAAREATPELVAVLEQGSTRMRCAAAHGLGCMGAAAATAVPPLVEALRAGQAAVRAAAALGAIGERGAIAVLAGLLVDADAAVREAAGKALTAIHKHWMRQPEVAQAVSSLVAALRAPAAPLRPAAVQALSTLERAARPAAVSLAGLLRDSSAAVREAAAEALPVVGAPAPAAVRALVPLLDDREPGPRRAAIRSLRALGAAARDAGPALAMALRNKDPETRALAEHALAAVDPALAAQVVLRRRLRAAAIAAAVVLVVLGGALGAPWLAHRAEYPLGTWAMHQMGLVDGASGTIRGRRMEGRGWNVTGKRWTWWAERR